MAEQEPERELVEMVHPEGGRIVVDMTNDPGRLRQLENDGWLTLAGYMNLVSGPSTAPPKAPKVQVDEG